RTSMHASSNTVRAQLAVPSVFLPPSTTIGRGLARISHKKSVSGGLKVSNSLAVGALDHGPQRCLAEIGDRLLPHLPAQGVMGQPLRARRSLEGRSMASEKLARVAGRDCCAAYFSQNATAGSR